MNQKEPVVARAAHRVDGIRFRRTDDAVTDETTTRFFADLLLPEKLTDGLSNAGFVHPSPIQWAALPLATKVGLDLVVQSKSGTGKTLVYVITALNMINTQNNALQALILAPTREIAVQGARVALDVAGACMPELKVHTFIGGLSITDDQVKLKKCHLAIGTPGRLKQLMEESHMSPQSIRFLALDEADRLMDHSFKNDVTWIFNRLPPAKQVMALSATYPEDLAKLLTTYMKDPSHVRLNQDCQVLKGVSQYVVTLPHHPQSHELDKLKFEALLTLLTSVTFSQCLVFTNYVIKAESFCERLNQHGWPAIFIASSQDQPTRLRALASLKQFQCRVLITTDLTARGIDAHNVNLIVNLEMPWDAETYLHRIGRAGRFGSYGVAVSLPSEGLELDILRNIAFQTGSQISILPYNQAECLPDLWKIQQAKNGIIKEEKVEAPQFKLLEPIEVLEAYEETHLTVVDGGNEHSEPIQEKLLTEKKKNRGQARKKKNKMMFESMPNETTDSRSNYSNGVKIENGPDIAFIQNGVVPKLSSNLNFSTCVDTDEIVDCNNYYENDHKYDEYYNDEGEVENNYYEDGKLSPNLVIKFYKSITGFEYFVYSETSQASCEEFKVDRPQMNEEEASAIFRQFCSLKLVKEAYGDLVATSLNVLSLDDLKNQVENLLNDAKNNKWTLNGPQDVINDIDGKECVDPEVMDAFRVLQANLDNEWSKKMTNVEKRLNLVGDLPTAVQMMVSGEELPYVSKIGDLVCQEIDSTNPYLFKPTTLPTNIKVEDVEDENLCQEEQQKDDYPEPYKAECEVVKTIEKSQKHLQEGECIWSIEQGFGGLEDYDEEEEDIGVVTSVGNNIHTSENSSFFQTTGQWTTGNYEYPFPDPDTVMHGFLAVPQSWKTAFPAWMSHIQQNKVIIEEMEYRKQMEQIETKF